MTIMKNILLTFLVLNFSTYLRGDEVTAVTDVAAVTTEVHAENPENPKVNETLIKKSPSSTKYIVQDPVKVMIRNVNSLLVLDGSEFVVKMAPLLGTSTQLWTFTRSAVDPNFIIFRNVANGRALTSWPYTRSIFSYDWADTAYTRWNLNRNRRLVSAAYPKDYLSYGYGPLAISLRYETASDSTDEWILVASKDNKISNGY